MCSSDLLAALPGVRCRPGEGTFYAFADIGDAMQTHGFHDDVAFCDALLERVGVAVVPGSGFGAPGHMRLSFATDMHSLERALGRLREFLGAA